MYTIPVKYNMPYSITAQMDGTKVHFYQDYTYSNHVLL